MRKNHDLSMRYYLNNFIILSVKYQISEEGQGELHSNEHFGSKPEE
jgi:hypothetical protein